MKKSRKQRLEKAGWSVGTAADFLELSEQESLLVDLKLALSRYAKECRSRRKLSQQAVAELIESSQSRIAKIEAGDGSVSIELILRSLFALGATPKAIARVIGSL